VAALIAGSTLLMVAFGAVALLVESCASGR
jgi:hypothetical protein